MYPKLSTEFEFSLTPVGAGVEIALVRLSDGAIKMFFQAGTPTEQVLLNFTAHMNSLTDELCGQFFPDVKVKADVKKEKTYVAPDLNAIKNLRVTDGKCFIMMKTFTDADGKKVKGQFQEVTKAEFHAELERRYGKGPADKWLEESE